MVSEVEKASLEASGEDQEDGAQPLAGGVAGDVSLRRGDIKTGCFDLAWEESGGCPLLGQTVSGMQAT